MKNRIEKNIQNEQLPVKNQTQKNICEDVYFQINAVAFKQNFKMLMGHYAYQTQANKQVTQQAAMGQ
jgi:hypothetical protein